MHDRSPVRRASRALAMVVAAATLACSSGCRSATPVTSHASDVSTLPSGLRRVDPHPLYVLDYIGDYDALVNTVPQREEEFFATGSSSGAEQDPTARSFGDECTLFSALGGTGRLYGRNRDMPSDTSPTLVLFTAPADGAASIAIVDMTSIGYQGESAPGRLEVAPLLIRDGMNAHGLAIAKADVAFTRPRVYDPARPYRNFMTAMREVLDHARDVPEAAAVLARFNVVFPGTGGHYLVADATGTSAVIEFDGAEMRVLPSAGPWQVATNFVLGTDRTAEPDWRYVEASRRLADAGGVATVAQTMEVLRAVSVPGHTLWSAAYDLGQREASIVVRQRFDTPHRFQLAAAPTR